MQTAPPSANPSDNLHLLKVHQLLNAMDSGEVSSVDAVKGCIERINAREGDVRAFAHFDPEYALEQAARLDAMRAHGVVLGPLHGIPVAVKDIIDTCDMPTENGLLADAGRMSDRDADVVRRLRAAGAVILGKTVTTEAAFYAPSKTRNPNGLDHTPGGSSAGSAAAVADFMVPLAIGTQTNGSVIRPASFCGVLGFKPTYGSISTNGILPLSSSLDQVGVFGRCVRDIALLADALTSSTFEPGQSYSADLEKDLITAPVLAFVPAPNWADAPDYAISAFASLCDHFDNLIEHAPLVANGPEGLAMHKAVMAAEMARNLAHYTDDGPDVSEHLRAIVEDGRRVSAIDYLTALSWRDEMRATISTVLDQYDAILTPSSHGEAPKTLDQTGDPSASTLWTFLGFPAISLPMLVGSSGMPMGVQLVGRPGDGGHLLRIARWLRRTSRDSE
ncbi:MAG: amidase [Pseudomonadota bacterium]